MSIGLSGRIDKAAAGVPLTALLGVTPRRMLGVTPGPVTGHTLAECVRPGRRPEVR